MDLPEIFTIETTLACNLQCPECAIGGNLIVRPKGYMNLEQFKIIAEKIQPFVKLCYLFNWGEPLLNPDIIKIIKHSSEKFNANLCVSTNGILVNDKIALELITSGISTIIVSIDGITQAVYEKYRKKGDLKKALVGLEMLQRHNLKLGNRVEILPQFIVFKHNQHEMEGFRSHCTSIGLRPLFKSPYLRNESKFENSDYPEFIRNQYPDIKSLRQAMKDCPDTRNSFVINSDGAVVGCCYDHNGCSPYGNIYKQDVLEIWNGDEFKKFRERVLSGNAPKFCVENCLYYVVDNSCGKKMINTSCGKKNSQMPKFNVHQDQIRHPLFDFPTPPEEKNILKRNNIQKRKKINFSIAFLTTYYDGFIKKFYKEKPELANERYDLQLSEILDQSFGDSDFYAEGMKSAGWKAADYIINCQPMQKMWAMEKQIKGSEIEIIYEQVRNSQPDVLYCQDMNLMPEKFLAAVRKYTKLVVGQIATPIRTQIPFHCYDIVFSSFPHYVERIRKSGVTTYYQPLAFENRILDKIQTVEFSNRKYPCVFVGGISNLHIESYKLLDALARMTPIEFWGYGVETTANDSQLRIRHHGEAWGLEMFNILASSKIIINRHGEVAENYANNMRLFEATGCGALLITDYKDNLNELFKVGEEIVAYRSPEECVALVKYYLSNPGEAAQIARAGQNRTLRDHTYWKRMYKSAEILERHLRYREEKDIYPVMKQISYGHKPIPKDMLTENLSMAWKDPSIPVKQRAVVQNELTGMYRGQPPKVYRVLANCLFPIAPSECTILEIGCASGYYYEALEYLLNKQLNYTGVDYSEPLIVMAKDLYPNTAFYVADGAQLPFEDKRFFISISSGMLLHVPNYVEHIKEAARVSARYIIAHRTPVCRRQKTQHLKKFAYGVETVELIFNEKEIISEFQLQGLKLLQADEYYSNHNQDHYEVTYLFEKEDQLKSHTSRERNRSDTIALPQKIKKPKMLNLGCGGRYHKDWINIDFNSSGPDVIKHNLCLGIPSPNEDFDVVYHSDILEHFPKSYAPEFLKECWRVLKPGGIIRVVQPDLEQIVRLYLDALDRSLQGDQEAQKRYDWLVIELLDQMVRNRSGGEMLEYWKQAPMPAEDFVIKRCGSEVLGALEFLRAKPQPIHRIEDPYLKAIRNNDGSQIKKMSLFRMSGEVHQWMYDRYSLKKMLGETGFVDIQQCCADQSEIPDFNSYLLDIEPNGNVRKPDSFFMEARKQI